MGLHVLLHKIVAQETVAVARGHCLSRSFADRCGVMQEDIVNAMALTGQVLMGQSVMVKSSEVSTLHSDETILHTYAHSACTC